MENLCKPRQRIKTYRKLLKKAYRAQRKPMKRMKNKYQKKLFKIMASNRIKRIETCRKSIETNNPYERMDKQIC